MPRVIVEIQGQMSTILADNRFQWRVFGVSPHVFSGKDRKWNGGDRTEIPEFLEQTDTRNPYPQRTNGVGVRTAARGTDTQEVGVNTSYTSGTGMKLFNQQDLVILVVIWYAKYRYTFKLNDIAGFNWVHFEDLAGIYLLLIHTISERQDGGVGYLPSRENGILFPAVGCVLHVEVAQGSLNIAFDAGFFPRDGTPKEKNIRINPPKELTGEIMTGIFAMAEQAWVGNKAQVGTMTKNLLVWKTS
ncbi:Epimerase domain-containing protein [Fusarium sp. LHS14.1]|nr:Epimerase domain-containing protein [Fusarium sp. LHS14.1]